MLNEEIIHHTLFSLQSYVGHTERQADLTSKQQQRLWEGWGGRSQVSQGLLRLLTPAATLDQQLSAEQEVNAGSSVFFLLI